MLAHVSNLAQTGVRKVESDSRLVPECIYRPGSFTGLMLIYESNFLKLSNLLGVLDNEGSRWISRVVGDNDLFVERSLSEAYTTTLRMTYWLAGPDGVEVRDPDLTVRIYHDAGQAEALNCRHRHHHRLLKQLAAADSELGRRWQRNMMLNKWLDYLLDRGHGFR
jgi:uncharacterized protein YqiB (DUF1249 family)